MTVPAIAFFNNRNEASKSILVFHLAWMLNDLGLRVVAADLDPQANLTTTFLDEDRLEVVWTDGPAITTIFDAVSALLSGSGDITTPILKPIDDRLALLVGDVALSSLEEDLAVAWPRCLDCHEHALRVSSAFWRITQGAAVQHAARGVYRDYKHLADVIRQSIMSVSYAD